MTKSKQGTSLTKEQRLAWRGLSVELDVLSFAIAQSAMHATTQVGKASIESLQRRCDLIRVMVSGGLQTAK